MVEISHLTYFYPGSEAPALRDLSLGVTAGDLRLIAGRSGSGKSTLLRALNGLVPRFYGGRFGGRVVVSGLDTRHAEPVELAGRVGFVFQEPENHFITRNVADEIAFGMEIAGLSGETIRSRVAEIIDRLELGPLVERPLDRLSGGEQQRVAVAAALGRQPPVLLMDEPTSQLDSQSAEAVLEWVVELRRELGLTALIVEHRLGRLVRHVDGIIYLSDQGDRVLSGPADQVIPAMPYGPPLVEAARALGLPASLDPRAVQELLAQAEGPVGRLVVPRRVPSGPARLAAKGLRFAYNGTPALEGVSLEAHPGEVVAVLGRNGSGKTTLLRCLMGLLSLQAGEVWLDGEAVTGRPVAERAKVVAYVPQWPSALLFADSVRDELALTLRNHGLGASPPTDPDTLLHDLGLSEVADRYPRDLSAGERQRAAVAAVLVTGPGVVLLDEPTLGIDPLAQARFGQLVEGWKLEGMAVVLATHDVEFAAAHADTTLVLDRGQVLASGPTAETLFSQPALRTSLQRLTGRPRPASVAELASLARPFSPAGKRVG
jgi:energy-coupling factor transporter ATP-binding protein EcfA2